MKVVRSALLLLALSGFAYAQERTTRSPNPTGEIISQTAPTAAETAATPLAKLVGEAEQSNPEIQAAQHTWKAATNVPKQVSALPETQLFIQHFSVGSPRPFAGFTNSEFAYIGIGGSQDIPYPGKRALRGQVAELEANSLHEDSESVRRRVVETLKLVYYRLAYIQQTLGILQRNDQLLKQIQQVIESRYGVGHGNQQDVLRAQLQHTKILQDIAMHHQDEGQLEAQLKQILNRPQTSPRSSPSLLLRLPSSTAMRNFCSGQRSETLMSVPARKWCAGRKLKWNWRTRNFALLSMCNTNGSAQTLHSSAPTTWRPLAFASQTGEDKPRNWRKQKKSVPAPSRRSKRKFSACFQRSSNSMCLCGPRKSVSKFIARV